MNTHPGTLTDPIRGTYNSRIPLLGTAEDPLHVSSQDSMTLAYIIELAHKEGGYCTPTIGSVAGVFGLNRKAIAGGFKRLREQGVLVCLPSSSFGGNVLAFPKTAPFRRKGKSKRKTVTIPQGILQEEYTGELMDPYDYMEYASMPTPLLIHDTGTSALARYTWSLLVRSAEGKPYTLASRKDIARELSGKDRTKNVDRAIRELRDNGFIERYQLPSQEACLTTFKPHQATGRLTSGVRLPSKWETAIRSSHTGGKRRSIDL